MGTIHVVDHVHEYIMFFQVFLQKSGVHCPKVLSGSPLLCLLLNILDASWSVVVCELMDKHLPTGLGGVRGVLCGVTGAEVCSSCCGFLESFLKEWTIVSDPLS